MSKHQTQNWSALVTGKRSGELNKKEINPENFEEVFREAMNLYMQGVGGDKQAVKDASNLLKRLYSYDPQNHLVEAYFGSVMALMGRDSVSVIDKFKNTNNGLKMLDHAVISEPDNVEIRNLRANVGFKLPEMYFHRVGIAIEDFMHIAAQYEKDETAVAPDLYWRTLFNIGSGFKILGYTEDSHSAWDKLLSVATDPAYKELVNREGYKTV